MYVKCNGNIRSNKKRFLFWRYGINNKTVNCWTSLNIHKWKLSTVWYSETVAHLNLWRLLISLYMCQSNISTMFCRGSKSYVNFLCIPWYWEAQNEEIQTKIKLHVNYCMSKKYPFYKVTYYTKWVPTSWTNSMRYLLALN